jgi:hypothetical protein
MTKFGKAEKTGCSNFLLQTVRFWQFQNMKKTGAKLGDLKIQVVLKQEEGLKGIKRLRWSKIKQEAEIHKNRIVRFPILEDPVFTDKVSE